MIIKYSATVKSCDSARLYPDLAYPLYSELLGHLMHALFAEKLHETGYTPISQYIETVPGDRSRAVWHLSIFGEEAISEFSAAINSLSIIELKDSGIKLQIEDISQETPITHKRLIAAASEIPDSPYWTIKFVTPTSFKSANRYTLFPSSELIIKSLVSKWNNSSSDYTFDDGDALRLLLSSVEISSYRLSSSSFRLKGYNIRSFVGTLGLTARVAAPLLQVLKTLLLFGQYSGIGIKTALGMGGIKLINF